MNDLSENTVRRFVDCQSKRETEIEMLGHLSIWLDQGAVGPFSSEHTNHQSFIIYSYNLSNWIFSLETMLLTCARIVEPVLPNTSHWVYSRFSFAPNSLGFGLWYIFLSAPALTPPSPFYKHVWKLRSCISFLIRYFTISANEMYNYLVKCNRAGELQQI